MFNYFRRLKVYFNNKIREDNLSKEFVEVIPPLFKVIYQYIVLGLKQFFLILIIFYRLAGGVAPVASGSMTPTLRTDALVAFSSIRYGLLSTNLPILPTFITKLLPPRLLPIYKPQLGDVFAFKIPTDDKIYTKRVLASGGDKIKIISGIPIINGVPVQQEFIRYFSYIDKSQECWAYLYKETLPNGISYFVLYDSLDNRSSISDNTEEFTIPEGYLFGMGDNRNNSDDSRRSIGFISINPDKNGDGGVLGPIIAQLVFSSSAGLNIFKFIRDIDWSESFKWIY